MESRKVGALTIQRIQQRQHIAAQVRQPATSSGRAGAMAAAIVTHHAVAPA